MTLSLAASILYGAERTLAAAQRTSLPVLLLHGAEDSLTPASGSRAFFAQLDGGVGELRIYPELRHEILNEPEWETVAGDLLEWMRKREAPGAGDG